MSKECNQIAIFFINLSQSTTAYKIRVFILVSTARVQFQSCKLVPFYSCFNLLLQMFTQSFWTAKGIEIFKIIVFHNLSLRNSSTPPV